MKSDDRSCFATPVPRCASPQTRSPARPKERSRQAAKIATPRELADLPPRGTRYLVGHARLSAMPADDGRELRGLVIAEADSGRCHVAPLMGYEVDSAARALFSVLAGAVPQLPRGWPISLTFDDPNLCEAVREGLEAQGVACRYDPVLGPVIEVVEGLAALGEGGEGRSL